MNHRVFISHAAEDAKEARAVCEALEKNQIPCWMAPRDVPLGSPFAESITEAVEGSKVLLVLLSKAANASKFVPREVDLALGKGVSILPLRLEDVEPEKGLKLYLRLLHRFDAFPPPLIDRIPPLVAAISTAVQKGLEAQEDQPSGVKELLSDAVDRAVEEADRDVTELVQKESERRGVRCRPSITNLLIFSTRKQKMWLSFTSAGVYCVLDNRPKGGQIRVQWFEPLRSINAGSVSALDRQGRPGLLRIGSHKNWLYTTALFGNGTRLKETVLVEAERALAGR